MVRINKDEIHSTDAMISCCLRNISEQDNIEDKYSVDI